MYLEKNLLGRLRILKKAPSARAGNRSRQDFLRTYSCYSTIIEQKVDVSFGECHQQVRIVEDGEEKRIFCAGHLPTSALRAEVKRDEKRKLAPWQHAVSGAVAGVISRFVISPLDVVKIRLQLQTDAFPLSRVTGRAPSESKYRGIIQSVSRIIREEGYSGLWKGNLSAEYLYLTYGAVQFYTYHQYEGLVKRMKELSGLKLPTELIAGGLAGSTATLATYPFDLLRTRFAVQGQDGPYTGIIHAVRQIYRTEGVRGFYRGVWPSTLQIMPQMGIVFSTYSYIKRNLSLMKAGGVEDFVSGGLAGMIGKTAVMPFDVVRKRLQVQGPERNSYIVGDVPRYPKSFLGCARQIVQHEGFLALYKGLIPGLLKAGPSAAVTFLVVGICERAFVAST